MSNCKKLLGLAFIFVLCGSALAANMTSLTPSKVGVEVPRDLHANHDGTFENGYAWQYDGNAPPDIGAFAECFDLTGDGNITSVTLWLTQVGNYYGQPTSVFIYDGSPPGDVLCQVDNVVFDAIAFWPNVCSHEVPIDCVVDGVISAGVYGTWPGDVAGYYIAADLDGPGGCPWTNIAPDIGYDPGWQDPSIVWGPTMSMGIGVTTSGSTATEDKSWGTVKSLY